MPLRIDIDGSEELSCTHSSLRRAARHLTQLYDAALAPSGLTSSQALVVSQIAEMGGKPGEAGPALAPLAKRLGIQISALTHALRPLVRDGLVDLAADGKDKRTKRAVLTEKGYRQTKIMHELWIATNRRIETVLGEGITDTLRELADKVYAADFSPDVPKER